MEETPKVGDDEMAALAALLGETPKTEEGKRKKWLAIRAFRRRVMQSTLSRFLDRFKAGELDRQQAIEEATQQSRLAWTYAKERWDNLGDRIMGVDPIPTDTTMDMLEDIAIGKRLERELHALSMAMRDTKLTLGDIAKSKIICNLAVETPEHQVVQNYASSMASKLVDEAKGRAFLHALAERNARMVRDEAPSGELAVRQGATRHTMAELLTKAGAFTDHGEVDVQGPEA